MRIKKKYIKPAIEEHFLDMAINLGIQSEQPPTPPVEVGPGSQSVQFEQPYLKSAPNYSNPAQQPNPFGGDSPDYSNM
ncbi:MULTISPECIES: hypothetical protein [unclassified Carboxylicivirga]|uniref:hypothetical protein n=1 Tax=Carboxylicivirga TaxID=1628153 RepID=UPI003D3394CF